jgi:hypothetical protein
MPGARRGDVKQSLSRWESGFDFQISNFAMLARWAEMRGILVVCSQSVSQSSSINDDNIDK